MTLTQTHLDFWRLKQAQPRWARPLLDKKAAKASDLIDRCINDHSGIRWSLNSSHTDTLISQARWHVEKGTRASLVDMLRNFGSDKATAFHRRAATARRWLARLESSRRFYS
jgi:hypothetical protein